MTFEVKLKASSTPTRKQKRKKLPCIIHINKSLNTQTSRSITTGQQAEREQNEQSRKPDVAQ